MQQQGEGKSGVVTLKMNTQATQVATNGAWGKLDALQVYGE